MTTRAFSKSVVVGVVPPNSPTVIWSYSNGRFIHALEALGGDGLAVDGHDAARERELRLPPRGEQRSRGGGERAREERQRDGGVGLDRDARRIGRELPPALRLFEARSRGAAEVRHVGDDLQRVAMAADFVAVELGLHARLVDEVLRRAA